MSRNKVEIYLTEIEWKFTYSIGDGDYSITGAIKLSRAFTILECRITK